MSTVRLVDENTNHPKVRAVFQDIKATKKIDRVPNIWRALATNPDHLELCWSRLKTIMQPGKIDLLTKEIIALAVSATNNCATASTPMPPRPRNSASTPKRWVKCSPWWVSITR